MEKSNNSFERLKTDEKGNVFLPMNVEGYVDDGFFTPLKLVATVLMLLIAAYEVMMISDGAWSLIGILMFVPATLIADFYVTRFVLLDEKYYFKMYKKMLSIGNPTPRIMWDIIDIHEYDDCSTLIFSDMKAGIFVKMERDTIVGTPVDNEVNHYNCVSDFHKSMNECKLRYIEADIMEHSDNDARLKTLDDVTLHCNNRNVAALIETETGYMKSLARRTLFESQYYMIYTPYSNNIEKLVDDSMDCLYVLTGGAYSGFDILGAEEINEFICKQQGVTYFDIKTAMMEVFKKAGFNTKPAFEIKEIEFEDGEVRKIEAKDASIIARIVSLDKKGKLGTNGLSIRDALDGVVNKKENINTSSIKDSSKGIETVTNNESNTNEIGNADNFVEIDELFFGDDSEDGEPSLTNNIEDASKLVEEKPVNKQDTTNTKQKKEKKRLFSKGESKK